MQWSGGELSVRAKGQALSAVLQDISRQTGLQVRGGVQQQDVVRADIGPETLADALRLLLADKNYLFVDGQGARPARLIILGSGGPGTVAISPVAPQPVPSNDPVSQHARALAGRDVAARIEAVERLGELDDERSQSLVTQALSDPNEAVRAVAREALQSRRNRSSAPPPRGASP